MHRVPILCKSNTQANICFEDYSPHLVICLLGARHGRSALDWVKWFRTSIGSSGQVHQVIEAKPMKKLDSTTNIQFIKGIIFRFEVPHSIRTYNGSNFDSDEFYEFCYSQGT